MEEEIIEAFMAPVTVIENGKRTDKAKIVAGVTHVANDSAKGDSRSTKLGLDIISRARAATGGDQSADIPLTKSDQEILDAFLAMHRDYLRETAL